MVRNNILNNASFNTVGQIFVRSPSICRFWCQHISQKGFTSYNTSALILLGASCALCITGLTCDEGYAEVVSHQVSILGMGNGIVPHYT